MISAVIIWHNCTIHIARYYIRALSISYLKPEICIWEWSGGEAILGIPNCNGIHMVSLRVADSWYLGFLYWSCKCRSRIYARLLFCYDVSCWSVPMVSNHALTFSLTHSRHQNTEKQHVTSSVNIDSPRLCLFACIKRFLLAKISCNGQMSNLSPIRHMYLIILLP